MQKALCIAADAGVDVRLVVPAIPDKKYVYMVAETYWGELLAHGVKIYRYTSGFVHAKSVMVDREVALVGSTNMDYRTFQLHYECAVLLYHMPAVEDLLEEIVGNIYDEFDEPEQPEIVPLAENEWRVTGSTPISSLVDDLDLPLPESDDYDTLGGMIVTRLNAIPKDGEKLDLEVNGVALHVEKIQEHRIESVVIRLLVPKAKKQRASVK